MKEEFLQFIWQTSLYKKENLCTTTGKPIQVLRPGSLNKDAGPDFFNSALLIDDMHWAGNVEVHLQSSEWMQHGHQYDAGYNNVVLHVVYEHDEEIINQLGQPIPTLELRSLIAPSILSKYNSLFTGQRWIACEHMITRQEREKMEPFVEHLFIERLEDRSRYIHQDLRMNQQNWEQTFYEHLARNFGFKTNALPFHILAKSLPIQLLAKHKTNLVALEALLFGQAGFLDQHFEEDHPNRLRKEYVYFKKAYQLEPINLSLWKFATMRPANFPTIRLAQFAKLIHGSASLFSRSMEIKSRADLEQLFNVEANGYWNNHYQFDQVSGSREKKLGRISIENIFINTIAPFMYAYGKEKLNASLSQRSIELMKKMPVELNGITNRWMEMGFELENAYQSQAYIQLKNRYCTPKKCLSCSIGNHILNK